MTSSNIVDNFQGHNTVLKNYHTRNVINILIGCVLCCFKQMPYKAFKE